MCYMQGFLPVRKIYDSRHVVEVILKKKSIW